MSHVADSQVGYNFKKVISGGVVLIAPKLLKAKGNTGNTVKLLTPDGKVVEVDESKIQALGNAPIASNTEVMDWMNSKLKNI